MSSSRTHLSDVETIEEQIWINSYLFAVARLDPNEAEIVADQAVKIYSTKWNRQSEKPFPNLPKS
jgi:hypothetical protein